MLNFFNSSCKNPFRSYLCLQIIRGALIIRAEIIPILPDPDNAGEGKMNKQSQLVNLIAEVVPFGSSVYFLLCIAGKLPRKTSPKFSYVSLKTSQKGTITDEKFIV